MSLRLLQQGRRTTASPARPAGTGALALPDADTIEGPAYPAGLKLASTVLVLATVVAGVRVRDALAVALETPSAAWLLAAAAVVVLAGWLDVLTSRTVIGTDRLVRRGLWRREVRYADITQVKLVMVPGLPWLAVPRLVVRTRGLGAATFRAGDARVLQAMRTLVQVGTRPVMAGERDGTTR